MALLDGLDLGSSPLGQLLFSGGSPAAPSPDDIAANAPDQVASLADGKRAMDALGSINGADMRSKPEIIQDYLKTGGVNLNPAEYAWCAAAVNSSMAQAGVKGTGSNMARSFLNWGTPAKDPQPGDLAVFSRGDPNGPLGHVGFFNGYDDNGNIRVLGANQNKGVNEKSFSPANLLAFRRAPDATGDPMGSALSSTPQPTSLPTQVASADPSFVPSTTKASPQMADTPNNSAGVGDKFSALMTDPMFMAGLKILSNSMVKRPLTAQISPFEGVPELMAALGKNQLETNKLQAQSAIAKQAQQDLSPTSGGLGGLGGMPIPGAAAADPASTPASASPGPGNQFASAFDAASKATGIPAPLLMAQAQRESQFNPNVIGKAGEIGLTQILPSTAADPGYGVKPISADDLKDPAKNALFGAQYLKARGEAAGVQDWNDPDQVAKALQAYNGGGNPNYASSVLANLPRYAGQSQVQGQPQRIASNAPDLSGLASNPASAADAGVQSPAASAPAAGGLAAGKPTAVAQADDAQPAGSSDFQKRVNMATAYERERDKLVARMANPLMDANTKSAYQAKIDIYNKNIAKYAPNEMQKALIAANVMPGTPDWNKAHRKQAGIGPTEFEEKLNLAFPDKNDPRRQIAAQAAVQMGPSDVSKKLDEMQQRGILSPSDPDYKDNAQSMYGLKDTSPAAVQEAEWYRKATPEQRAAYDKVKSPMVNIDQRQQSAQENAYGGKIGTDIAENYGPQAMKTAYGMKHQLALMSEASDRAGNNIYTGPFANEVLRGKQLIAGVTGQNVDGLPESEIINKLGFGLATNALRAISSRGTQMEFGKSLENVPGLLQSTAGRKALINIFNQDQDDTIALSKLAAKKENRDNWAEVVSDYYDKNPVKSPFDPSKPFGQADVDRIQKDAAQNGGASPPPGPASSPASGPSGGASPAPRQIWTKKDFDALQSGDEFLDPKGNVRRKP